LDHANESGLGQTVVAGWLMATWGEVLAELNELDEAARQAKKGVELTERGGDLAMLGSSYLCLVRVLYSCKDLDGATATIRKLEKTAREKFIPPWIMNQSAAWQARLWLAQGRLKAAAQWIEERGLDLKTEPTYPHELEYIVLARILIAQKRLDEATNLLKQLHSAADAGGRTSRVIEILNLQALTLQAQGDTDQAISTLEKALALAEPGGFVRIFVDEGPAMAHLLYEAVSRGTAADYVQRLLAAFPVDKLEKPGPSQGQSQSAEYIEPLSGRELEVLQLIADGLTNQDIAGRLYISLNTVKAHTRNIYSKLGVNSRTHAVAKARATGILPPT